MFLEVHSELPSSNTFAAQESLKEGMAIITALEFIEL